jgi:hypothetical protein
LILCDSFIKRIQDGEVLEDTEFFLYEYKDGAIVKQNYLGCWVLCDNGYLAWSTTIPPYKCSKDRRAKCWSEWIESMRKDVECTFGILKGRWRILKTGIRLHGTKPANHIFKTCCALHNWLLEIDGLDNEWDRGVPSEWEGSLGQHHVSDPQTADFFALHRLEATNVHYDLCSTGYEEEEVIIRRTPTSPRPNRCHMKPLPNRLGRYVGFGNCRFNFSAVS